MKLSEKLWLQAQELPPEKRVTQITRDQLCYWAKQAAALEAEIKRLRAALESCQYLFSEIELGAGNSHEAAKKGWKLAWQTRREKDNEAERKLPEH